ncbi:MAG: CPBP family intramembrane metalloprotease, partial [Candidatus Omnitrophica bacterium]|nr:CPBP family intramembrane metalloprotease [Candidatus Omnitrophota bacterium]
FFILGLIFIIIFDLRIFLRLDQEKVKERFRFPARFINTLVILFFLLVVFIRNQGDVAGFFLLCFVLPIYIIRRNQIQKEIWQTDIKAVETELNTAAHDHDPLTLRLMSDGLGVAIIWIYWTAMLSLGLKALDYFQPKALSEFAEVIISAFLSWVFILILIYKPAKNFSKGGFLTNIGLKRKGKSFLKVFVVPALAGIGFAWISATIITTRQVQPQTPLNEVIESSHSLGLGILFVLMAVLMAPFIEEIVFRGYYYHVIQRYKGRTFAVYFVALTFAFLHVGQYWSDWPAIIMVTLLGFVLTLLRVWADSTLASVVMHYFYNGCVVIFPVLFLLAKNPAYLEYRVSSFENAPQKNIELLRKSIEYNPDLAEAYNDLAWIYSENDQNLEEALLLIDKALSYDQKNVAFIDTKAQVLTKLGRIEDAMAIREGLLQNELSDDMRVYQNEQLDKLYEMY